jgi:hypothetical protein
MYGRIDNHATKSKHADCSRPGHARNAFAASSPLQLSSEIVRVDMSAARGAERAPNASAGRT